MNPIAAFLERQGMMVLDGAMATQLEARGLSLADSLWSAKVLMEEPQTIAQVHLDYFEAGADCAITASYQATIPGFMARGLTAQEAAVLLERSVSLAAQARETFWSREENRQGRLRPVIAGSVGPYGAYLADGSEYRGHYTIHARELEEFHRPRMEILARAGADLFACETIPCLEEAQIVAKIAGELHLSCWVSFSCRNETEICEGTPIAQAAAALEEYASVAAVGINCTAPEYVASLVREVRQATEKPIVVYPNSGEIYDPLTKTWHGPADGQTFAQRSQEWYEAGARLLGGCCRTTPGDIRQLSQWLRNL